MSVATPMPYDVPLPLELAQVQHPASNVPRRDLVTVPREALEEFIRLADALRGGVMSDEFREHVAALGDPSLLDEVDP